MSAGALGTFLGENIEIFRRAGGVIVIIFGLHIAGVFKINILNRQLSAAGHVNKITGWGAAFLTGCAFALGWTPCVGPVLASILALAGSSADVAKGFWLLLFYSLGLAVPFLLTAVFIKRFFSFFNFIKKYYKQVEIFSGVLLICVGIALINNWFVAATSFLLQQLPQTSSVL
jgi:cytochrome c-type biogenesis protein